MKCSQCHTDNPDNTNFCGNCGAQLGSVQKETSSFTKTLVTPLMGLDMGASFAERYHIIEEIGKGGMGRVYKALDTKIDEKIAIKVLNPEIALDEKNRERFRNELKITRNLSHRYICRMYDFNEEEGVSYVTMEYVSGENLKSLIRRIGQVSPGKAIFIARQIGEGLAEAHRAGVIHRDLKPQNIMIDQEGNVRIMDFGIARSFRLKGVTEAGTMLGTPEYMSPEQVGGKDIDHQTDIYSLGIILYEMLTGRTPFEGDTPLSVAVKQKTERPPDPRKLNAQIPESISRLILRCLEKERRSRFKNAEELVAELKRIEDLLPKTDRVVPEKKTRISREITVKFSLRKLLFPAIAAIAVVVVALTVGRPWLSKKSIPLVRGKPSLAVMHFENNTGDEGLDHWRKALSDLLIADLGQSRFLYVLSSEGLYDILEKLRLLPARSYSSKDLRDVATRGGVRYVLAGKMTRAGETFRLDATLHDTKAEKIIGSGQVEGEEERSLFVMVDKLTTQIKENFDMSAEDIASDIDQEVQNISTSSPEAIKYFREGLKFHYQGDYSKSIPLMELAVAIDPEFAMAYRIMSIDYNNLGYSTEGQKRLEKAFELSNRVSERERFYILADFFRDSEKALGKAIDSYTKLLELYPDDHIGNNNLGALYLSIEDWNKAVKQLEINKSNNVLDYHSYSNLSNAYLALDKIDKARQVNEFFLKNISDNAIIRGNLANIHLLEKDYSLAVTEAEKALTLDPNYFNYYAIKGSVFYAQDEFDQAEAEYQKLLDIKEPSAHIAGRTLLSELYLSQGKTGKAENEVIQRIELADMVGEKSWEIEALMALANIYLISGRMSEAHESNADALNMAVENKNDDLWKAALYEKGLIHTRWGRLETAQKAASELKKKILEGMNEKEIRLFHHLNGHILLETGRASEAIQKFKEALVLLPAYDKRQPVFMESLAEALHKEGELDNALKAYGTIIDCLPCKLNNGFLYALAHYKRAKGFLEKGKKNEAKQHFEEFVRLWKNADPDLPELRDAKRQLATL